jgi:polar amino acid transport system substrate-binding protein
MRHALSAIILLTVFVPFFAHAEVLTVSYLDRPPYYYTDKDGNPSGFLVELAREVFRDAGIEVAWKELPPNRVMYERRKKRASHCSIGWFRTQEREAYAKFSIPVYQDKPLVIMTTRENALSSHTIRSLEVFSGHRPGHRQRFAFLRRLRGLAPADAFSRMTWSARIAPC